MKLLVLLEHERLWQGSGDDESPQRPQHRRYLPEHHFQRLRRFDRARPEDQQIFSWEDGSARARQWVGVIQLPGLIVEILPKIDRSTRAVPNDTEGLKASTDASLEAGAAAASGPDRSAAKNLLYMLAVAGDVPLRPQDFALLSHRDSTLSETLAALFASRLLDEMRRGPARGYLALEDNLPQLKGKLRLGPHLVKNGANRARFYCEYEAFAEDIPLNRVFRAVCHRLRALARAPSTQEALQHCLMILDAVSDVADPQVLLSRITLTRQQERFADLYAFARLILEHEAPLPGAGDARCFSLMFDMNIVFERFIAGFLRRYVLEPGIHQLIVQGRGYPACHLLVDPQGAGVLRLTPDLMILCGDAQPLVIDTKWKRLSPAKERQGVGSADLYQLYAYATRFDAACSLLLFPETAGVAPVDYHLEALSSTSGRVQRIGVRFAPLQGRLWEAPAREALQERLSVMLVGSGEGGAHPAVPSFAAL